MVSFDDAHEAFAKNVVQLVRVEFKQQRMRPIRRAYGHAATMAAIPRGDLSK